MSHRRKLTAAVAVIVTLGGLTFLARLDVAPLLPARVAGVAA